MIAKQNVHDLMTEDTELAWPIQVFMNDCFDFHASSGG